MRRIGHQLSGAALAAAMTTGVGPAVGAQDLPPLRENAHVWNSLFAAAVGDEIQRKCPDISPRLLRAIQEAKKLESYARSLGYTRAQIEAFVKSKAEQDRMRKQRDAYFAKNGVQKRDAESYCRLGREEIARNTLTGTLLRQD